MKIAILGASYLQLPLIEKAKANGFETHCFAWDDGRAVCKNISDYFYDLSVLEKKLILEKCQELNIDGILTMATDICIPSISYVVEKMNLIGNSYQTALLTTNKGLMRECFSKHRIASPFYQIIEDFSQLNTQSLDYPLIVKPTDSAGSKGVTRVDRAEDLEDAVKYALKHSISERVIVEEFIEKEGCSSDTDCFSVDGELKFVSFSAQRFDEKAANPYTPSAFSWPSTMTKEQEAELTSELQRVLHLLGMRTSIYNVETRIGKNGKTYIMEVSPRGGGNRLAEMLRYATGVDLITNAVRAAVGEEVVGVEQKPYQGYWAEVVLHADRDGCFNGLEMDDEFRNKHVKEVDLWVEKGDTVSAFRGANDAIGTLVVRFDTDDELQEFIKRGKDKYQIVLK